MRKEGVPEEWNRTLKERKGNERHKNAKEFLVFSNQVVGRGEARDKGSDRCTVAI